MTANPIRILIADSHYLIRQGLKSIFQTKAGFQVVGETEHFERVPELVRSHEPQVVVIGLNIQGISAVDLIDHLLVHFPDTKILVLDTNEEVEEVVNILGRGVHGYILKQCDHQEIVDAVNSILLGKNFFCSNVLKLNKTNALSHLSQNNGNRVQLSEREIQILSLISEGLTNKEIGDKIFISAHTVASHRKNLMKKFQAKNNVDLVISAIKENLIVP